MNRVLLRSSLNFFGRHPWQLFLAILGIALGVAVVVSIALVKNSAQESFAHSTQTIVGKATHRLVGGPGGIDESFYTKLRVDYGLRNIAPIVSGYVKASAGELSETLILLGTDPFAEGNFREYSKLDGEQAGNNASTLVRLLSEADTALLDRLSAERFSLVAGDTLQVLSGGQQKLLSILASFDSELNGSVYNLQNLLLSDISTAQEILSMPGRLSHIDVLLDENSPLDEHALRKLLPDDIEMLDTASQSASLRQMSSAFHTNLTALSLLALLVGMFLIFNTMTFLVVQRRMLIGKLRALGTSRAQVFLMIALEAFIIGTIATVLGLILGIQLAESLLLVVGRTINELYYFLPDTGLTLNPGILIKGTLLGIFATVIAAMPAALEAAAVHPGQAMQRSALEINTRALSSKASLAGLACLLAGLALIQLSGNSVAPGFTAIFIIILGFALLTPFLTLISMALLKPLLSKLLGISGRQACESVSASLSRTTAAIAALMISIATVIGIGLMVNNFRFSVNQWLESLLRADLYVSVAGPAASASNNTLDMKSLQRIRELEAVDEVSSVRRIQIETDTGRVDLVVYGLNARAYKGFEFREKIAGDIWQSFEQERTLIVSEPYAYHNNVRLMDRISLRTDQGRQEFSVTGIYKDYGSDRGVVSMSRRNYEKYWQDRRYSGFGIYAHDSAALEALAVQIKQLKSGQNLIVEDRRHILQASLEVFDQTFLITEILRVLALIIAFVSVMSALMALQLERTREHGLLRALGMLPSELRKRIMTETGLLGLVAGLFAIPVGCSITALLIYVINRRSFGWSMDLHLDAGIILQALAMSLIAALLAGIYPAWRMSQTRPAEALRAE